MGSRTKQWPGPLGALALLALAAGSPGPVFAAIKKCVDPVTKAVSYAQVCNHPQGPTAAESEASAAAARARDIENESKRSAQRADRQLLTRFPNETAHRRAHVSELSDVARKLRLPTARFADLVALRKPLDVQAAFYVGNAAPPELQRKIDANEALFAGLADVFRELQLEVAKVDAHFGNERARLSRLWAGAPPGSLGPLSPAPTPTLPR